VTRLIVVDSSSSRFMKMESYGNVMEKIWQYLKLIVLEKYSCSCSVSSVILKKKFQLRAESCVWENERKESVFLSLTKGKHFPSVKLLFLIWLEFSFLWPFSYIAAKHGKSRKVNFRNSLSCNQTWPKCTAFFCSMSRPLLSEVPLLPLLLVWK